MGRTIGHFEQPVNLVLFRRSDCNGIPRWLRVQIWAAEPLAVIVLTLQSSGPVELRQYLPQMLQHELKHHDVVAHFRSKQGLGML
jgi:hypothetical protein